MTPAVMTYLAIIYTTHAFIIIMTHINIQLFPFYIFNLKCRFISVPFVIKRAVISCLSAQYGNIKYESASQFRRLTQVYEIEVAVQYVIPIYHTIPFNASYKYKLQVIEGHAGLTGLCN